MLSAGVLFLALLGAAVLVWVDQNEPVSGKAGRSTPAERRVRESGRRIATRNEWRTSETGTGADAMSERERRPEQTWTTRAREKEHSAALARLERDWEEALAAGLAPADLLERQRGIAARAAEELGTGPAMGRFMEFLKGKGAGDALDWLATEGLAPAFSGPRAAGARRWLSGLRDAKLAEKIAFQAGRGYGGADRDGFTGYLYGFGDIHVQSALLAGYCAGMAGSDPEGAVQAFSDTLESDAGRAWEAAAKIGDFKRRVKAARKVYEEWALYDPQGAQEAWNRLFAPKPKEGN